MASQHDGHFDVEVAVGLFLGCCAFTALKLKKGMNWIKGRKATSLKQTSFLSDLWFASIEDT
ncbi:hypothetical protein N7467_005339 [Penicillium canescens]|nr:hypothetical protein N7467_005339 [Penicillium canescens]